MKTLKIWSKLIVVLIKALNNATAYVLNEIEIYIALAKSTTLKKADKLLMTLVTLAAGKIVENNLNTSTSTAIEIVKVIYKYEGVIVCLNMKLWAVWLLNLIVESYGSIKHKNTIMLQLIANYTNRKNGNGMVYCNTNGKRIAKGVGDMLFHRSYSIPISLS